MTTPPAPPPRQQYGSGVANPDQVPRSRLRAGSVLGLVGLVVGLAIGGAAGYKSASGSNSSTDSLPAPTVTVTEVAPASAPSPTSPSVAPTTPAAATTPHLGDVLTVTDDTAGTEVRVTVANLRRAKLSQFGSTPKGVEYEVTATYLGVSGSVDVNPLFFQARDAAGDTFDSDLGQVDDQLASTTVGPGQRVRGAVSFDVPTGKRISLITFGVDGSDAAWAVP